MRAPALTALAAALAVAGAPAADGAVRDVDLGGVAEGAPSDAWTHAFLPSTVRVRAGDSVRITPYGDGVAFVPGAGAVPPPLVLDASGAPVVDPVVATRTASGAPVVAGRALSAGLPGDEEPEPWAVRFPRTGTFIVRDALHPGVRLTVRVVGRRTRVPGAAELRAARRRALAGALRRQRALTRRKPVAGRVLAGPQDGPAALERFVPSRTTLRAGQTLVLEVPAGASSRHTFTFGPTLSGLEDRANGLLTGARYDPTLALPSAPGDPLVHTAAAQRELLGTGLLGVPGRARSVRMRFDEPGTFRFLCVVHPGSMRGTVTVTP
ncbi:hypothetical protein [Conexibacter sp. SYSU D00693]|uniref:hypothetical protein n=1 Tax=Conexibacter sp. SYSU D00693 TaxID=2812560 RepID=UPI00196AC620|nr:hypothetical protein [Conexibacter sp. SYSU D00693]